MPKPETKEPEVSKLPDTIYVKQEKDGDDIYLCAYYDTDSFDNGDIVGIYELKNKKKFKVKVTRTLV